MNDDAIDLAKELATRPIFDSLHDPDTGTVLVEPYHDPVGYPTQGYGRLLSRERWAPLDRWPAITVETALDWLKEDLERSARWVAKLIKVDLASEQEAALIDFTFNCGPGNLQISTLRRVINRGEFHEAPKQFKRWVYAKGVKLPGLVRRRVAEAELWASA